MSDKFIEDTVRKIASTEVPASYATIRDVLEHLNRLGLLNRPDVMVEDLEPGTHFRADFTYTDGTEFVTLRGGCVLDLSCGNPNWAASNEDFSNVVVLN